MVGGIQDNITVFAWINIQNKYPFDVASADSIEIKASTLAGSGFNPCCVIIKPRNSEQDHLISIFELLVVNVHGIVPC